MSAGIELAGAVRYLSSAELIYKEETLTGV